MPSKSLPQIEEEVKCDIEWCDEPTFRKGELCWDHFIEEATAAWNDHADGVAQAHAVSVGRG